MSVKRGSAPPPDDRSQNLPKYGTTRRTGASDTVCSLIKPSLLVKPDARISLVVILTNRTEIPFTPSAVFTSLLPISSNALTTEAAGVIGGMGGFIGLNVGGPPSA